MITKENIQSLYQIQNPNCISIYIPTYRAGHNQEDKLRFKNAVNEAKDALVEKRGMEEKVAAQRLKSAYGLLENDDFWLHLSDGLSVFIVDGKMEYFISPISFNPWVGVDSTFYLRPLMPLVNRENRFFLLALSQNEVRFFDCNQYSITPVIIEDLVPKNMEEALAYDDQGGQLQAHSSGGTNPVFHGHHLGKDHKVKDLQKFFTTIDRGLMKMLHDERAPMILATVDYEAPIYRAISDYSNIVDFHINGNPENDGPVLLHEKAWRLMKDYYKGKLNHQKRFEEKLSERKASTVLSDIINAAYDGRVEVVYLDKNVKLWGAYDPDHRSIKVHGQAQPDSVDLLEQVARKVFENGGMVYQHDQNALPHKETHANAVLRF